MYKNINILIVVLLLFGINNYLYAGEVINTVELDVNFGFGGQSTPEGWIPLSISLQNYGNNVEGKIAISLKRQNILQDEIRITEYIIPVKLPSHSTKVYYQSIFFKKDYFFPVNIKFYQNGKLTYNEDIHLEKYTREQLILIVSEKRSGYGFLRSKENYRQRGIIYLAPDMLPEDWLGYREIDIVILAADNLAVLNNHQINALGNWAALGNTIILSGDCSSLSYNSILVRRLFPYQIDKKLTINLNNTTAELWQVKDGKGEVLKQNGQLPQVLIKSIDSGEFIFTALNPLDIEEKKNLFENIIVPRKSMTLTEDGFLDYLTAEMFGEVSYYLPPKISILALILTVIITTFILFSLFKQNYIHLFQFILIYLFSMMIISSLTYVFLVAKIPVNNSILSEVNILKKKPSGIWAQGEGYYTYLSFQGKDTAYSITKDNGYLGGLTPRADIRLGEKYSFIVNGNRVLLQTSRKGRITGGFRSYYHTSMPVNVDMKKEEEGFLITVNNRTSFNVDEVFYYYKNKWWQDDGPVVNKSRVYHIRGEGVNLRQLNLSSQKLNLPNLGPSLLEKILLNIENDLKLANAQDYIYIILYISEGYKSPVNIQFQGRRQASCFLLIPVKI